MPRTATSAAYSQMVGAEVRRFREQAGLTQAECARRLDCSATYWQSVETGRANLTLGQLARIAAAIGAFPRLTLEGMVELPELPKAVGSET